MSVYSSNASPRTFDPTRLTDEPAQTIKMNAITEWAALPDTEATQHLDRFRKSLAPV